MGVGVVVFYGYNCYWFVFSVLNKQRRTHILNMISSKLYTVGNNDRRYTFVFDTTKKEITLIEKLTKVHVTCTCISNHSKKSKSLHYNVTPQR